jgi:hypothetical protein
MAAEDSGSRELIYWDDQMWAIGENNELVPLAVIYDSVKNRHALVDREDYKETKLQTELNNMPGKKPSMRHRAANLPPSAVELARFTRKTALKDIIEGDARRRFDGQYEKLCAIAPTLVIQNYQLEIEFPNTALDL